tara:strand:- start:588 stop:1073 length:486 start_codon:yes stop_codon:yes gene_type:complete
MVTTLPKAAIPGLDTTDSPVFAGINVGEDTLTVYDEGTWTPVMKIGSTTISTSTNHAKFTRIGSIVYFCAYIAFNRGTNTGDVTITGLPVAASASGVATLTTLCGNSINATNLVGLVAASGSTLSLHVNSAATGGSQANMSATHIAASTASSINFSGFYFV